MTDKELIAQIRKAVKAESWNMVNTAIKDYQKANKPVKTIVGNTVQVTSGRINLFHDDGKNAVITEKGKKVNLGSFSEDKEFDKKHSQNVTPRVRGEFQQKKYTCSKCQKERNVTDVEYVTFKKIEKEENVNTFVCDKCISK